MRWFQRLSLVCLLVAVLAGVRLNAFSDPRPAVVSAWNNVCVDGINVYQDGNYPDEHPAWFEMQCSCEDGSCLDYYAAWCDDQADLAYDYCNEYYCGINGLVSGCSSDFATYIDSGIGCFYCET